MLSRYEQGWSVEEIAAEQGVSRGTVGNRLRSLPEYRPRPAGEPPLELPDDLAERYEAGASIPQLAREYGVSNQTVNRRLRAAGVPVRQYTGRRGKWSPDYDEAQLREMSERGMTCREIGEALGKPEESVRKAMRSRGVPRQEARSRMEHNHFWRGGLSVDEEGYILQKSPDHPSATTSGYVRQHRLVMERELGRYLSDEEVVDHRNGDTSDNRPENLRVFPRNSEHLRATLTGKKKLPPDEREALRQAAVRRARQRVAAILAGSGSGDGR